MKKKIEIYLFIVLVVLGVFLSIYYLNISPTGYAIFNEKTISPSNGTVLTENLVEFVATVLSIGTGIQNVTLTVFNSTGELIFNETNSSGINGTYIFNESFDDGLYKWSLIVYEDNQSNSTEERTFIINTTQTQKEILLLSIISPKNDTYDNSTQLVNISVNSSAGIDSVWYNWNGTNKTYNWNGTNKTYITFKEDSINTLIVWVKDTNGNENSTSVTFTISDYVTVWRYNNESNDCNKLTIFESNKQSNDYDKQEDCEAEIQMEGLPETTNESLNESLENESTGSGEEPVKTSIAADDIPPISISKGETKEISWNVRNTGQTYYGTCDLVFSGEMSEWLFSITSDESGNLNPGNEEGKNFVFKVSVPNDTISGKYVLSASVNCATGISISKEFTVNVIEPINKSTEKTENVTKESATITGSAIFEGIGTGGFIILFIVILTLIFVFIASRRMRKKGKSLKDVLDGLTKNPLKK